MEGWVDLGYPVVHRPGVELATFRSRVERPTTTPPSHPYIHVYNILCKLVKQLCMLVRVVQCRRNVWVRDVDARAREDVSLRGIFVTEITIVETCLTKTQTSVVSLKPPLLLLYYKFLQLLIIIVLSIIIHIHRVSKKCAKLFSSELCQISTNCENFWHRDGR